MENKRADFNNFRLNKVNESKKKSARMVCYIHSFHRFKRVFHGEIIGIRSVALSATRNINCFYKKILYTNILLHIIAKAIINCIRFGQSPLIIDIA